MSFWATENGRLLFQRVFSSSPLIISAPHLSPSPRKLYSLQRYIYTVGTLEPSHVIFRYLDAPKIPLLARYLEALRSRDLASPVHSELLKTCYLKLNDVDSAEAIAASLAASSAAGGGGDAASAMAAITATLSWDPRGGVNRICVTEVPDEGWDGTAKDPLTVLYLNFPRIDEAISVHGLDLARALPRETTGVCTALCDGIYSPMALADSAARMSALTPLTGGPRRSQSGVRAAVLYISCAYLRVRLP